MATIHFRTLHIIRMSVSDCTGPQWAAVCSVEKDATNAYGFIFFSPLLDQCADSVFAPCLPTGWQHKLRVRRTVTGRERVQCKNQVRKCHWRWLHCSQFLCPVIKWGFCPTCCYICITNQNSLVQSSNCCSWYCILWPYDVSGIWISVLILFNPFSIRSLAGPAHSVNSGESHWQSSRQRQEPPEGEIH